jgi:phage protein D
MFSRQTQIKLKYDDTDISLDVEKFVKNIRYVDRTLPDKMDELSVTFQDIGALWRNEWFPEQGAKLEATFKVTDWFTQGDSFERECGGFEIDDLTSKGPPAEFTVSAVSIGITSSIRRQQNTKAWENADIKTIATDIAAAHGFELQWYSEYNPTLERWEQKSESDLSLIKKICEYAGLMLKITDKYLVIFRGEEFDAEKPEKKIRVVDDGVKSWTFNANSADIYSACEVKYYDPVKKELLEYIYTPDGISGVRGGKGKKGKGPTTKQVIDPETRMVETVTIPDPNAKAEKISEPEIGQILKVNRRCTKLEEAEEVAKAALRNKNMRQLRGTLTLMGRPDLYSGMNIEVQGFGRWDTVIWNVEEISHDYSKSSGYTSTLSLRGVLGY